MSEFTYAGSELHLFAAMRNWKRYWSGQIQPFVGGDVLEVGAGIGTNTSFLDRGGSRRWVCLEPDAGLVQQLSRTLQETVPGRPYDTLCGTLGSLGNEQFDTIIYIDVLEHIENDREELDRAAFHLRPGGHLIVVAPAHQRLFSPFDAAVGHFRRYDRHTLRAAAPGHLQLRRLTYLDSGGLFLSAANRLLLRQSMPTRAQLRFWDRWIVPLSRVFDRMLSYSVGKTIVGVWQSP